MGAPGFGALDRKDRVGPLRYNGALAPELRWLWSLVAVPGVVEATGAVYSEARGSAAPGSWHCVGLSCGSIAAVLVQRIILFSYHFGFALQGLDPAVNALDSRI